MGLDDVFSSSLDIALYLSLIGVAHSINLRDGLLVFFFYSSCIPRIIYPEGHGIPGLPSCSCRPVAVSLGPRRGQPRWSRSLQVGVDERRLLLTGVGHTKAILRENKRFLLSGLVGFWFFGRKPAFRRNVKSVTCMVIRTFSPSRCEFWKHG